MSDADDPGQRRVLVGLGVSADDEAVLDIAASLAAAIGAQLAALYVEDIALLDLAELPFTQIVSATNRPSPALTRENMEAALQREAIASRRAVSVYAERVQASWSFGTVRGSAEQEIRSAAASGDIVVVRAAAHETKVVNLVARARSAAATASGAVVALSAPTALRGPVVVFDDGDAAGSKSIELGCAIASARKTSLEILAVPVSDEQNQATLERARRLTDGQSNCRIRLLASAATADICEELERIAPSFIVGDLSGAPFGSDEEAQELINRAHAPALLLVG